MIVTKIKTVEDALILFSRAKDELLTGWDYTRLILYGKKELDEFFNSIKNIQYRIALGDDEIKPTNDYTTLDYDTIPNLGSEVYYVEVYKRYDDNDVRQFGVYIDPLCYEDNCDFEWSQLRNKIIEEVKIAYCDE